VTERLARGEAPVGLRAQRRISQASPRSRTCEPDRRGVEPHKSWSASKETGPPTRPHRASPRLDPGLPSWEPGTKSAGGAGRRREGARARRSTRQTDVPLRGGVSRVEWGRRLASVRRKRTPAGSPLDGGTRGSIDRAGRRILGARARDRSTGLVTGTRRLCSRSRVRHAGSPRAEHDDAKDRTRGLAGAGFQGERSPGEHRPDDLTPARAGVAARTDSGGEQSFEVGVPAVYRRARRSRAGKAAVDALRRARRPLPAAAGNRRPGPSVR